MGNKKSKSTKQKCNCKVEHCCKHQCFSQIENATELIQTTHYGWIFTNKHKSILQQTLKTLKIQYTFHILIELLTDSDTESYQGYYHKNISSFANNGHVPCSHWLNKLDNRTIKICLLGCGAQGKTTMIHRLITNTFLTEYDPTIEETWRFSITLNPNDVDKDTFEENINRTSSHNDMNIEYECCILDIMDTAGQEEFMALMDEWIRLYDFFMLLFSTKNEYKSCIEIVKRIKRMKGDIQDKNYGIMFVATKRDLAAQNYYTIDNNVVMEYCIKQKI
eukprot:48657_1